MKKILLTLLISTFAVTLNAQTFGATGLDVNGSFSQSAPVYRQWLRLGNTPNVVMKFEQTPQGIDDAVDMVQRMLIENELSISYPDIYKNIDVKLGDGTSENLHKALQNGKAKINMAWFSPDGSLLHLFLAKNSYEVNVHNAYKL